MNNFQDFFKNKKVTVMGLGLLGKRLGDIVFLAECGAKVLVTDLKTKRELAPSIKKLEKYKIKYVLGEHRFKDFENCDFVLKGQGVALDSPYIAHARKKGIPIEMDESLFAKLAPGVKIIGVTGTRGKTTTTILIYEILKAAFSSPSTMLGIKKPRVFLGGNIKGTAALPLLKEVRDGDYVVFELSSWQLQGFGEAKISPHISVFTNFMPDHMNYYASTSLSTSKKLYFTDKSYIYKFQKKDDVLILGSSIKKLVKNTKSKKIFADIKNIPKSWHINLPGVHNLENISCAVEVARFLKIDEEIVKKTIKKFNPISGRLEFVKNIKGVDIYNDNNSTTPEATQVALKALNLILSGVGHPTQVSNTRRTRQRKIVLIMGGTDKNLELKKLVEDIKKYVKVLVLISGNGTNRISPLLHKIKGLLIHKEKDLNCAVSKAYFTAEKGDIILFSPAFTSFGMFNNEYERGEQFMKTIKTLK